MYTISAGGTNLAASFYFSSSGAQNPILRINLRAQNQFLRTAMKVPQNWLFSISRHFFIATRKNFHFAHCKSQCEIEFCGPIKKNLVRYTGAKCYFGTGGESEHPGLASPGPGLLFRPCAQNTILHPCSEKYIYNTWSRHYEGTGGQGNMTMSGRCKQLHQHTHRTNKNPGAWFSTWYYVR